MHVHRKRTYLAEALFPDWSYKQLHAAIEFRQLGVGDIAREFEVIADSSGVDCILELLHQASATDNQYAGLRSLLYGFYEWKDGRRIQFVCFKAVDHADCVNVGQIWALRFEYREVRTRINGNVWICIVAKNFAHIITSVDVAFDGWRFMRNHGCIDILDDRNIQLLSRMHCLVVPRFVAVTPIMHMYDIRLKGFKVFDKW